MKIYTVIFLTLVLAINLSLDSFANGRDVQKENEDHGEEDEFAFDAEEEDLVEEELIREKRSPRGRGGARGGRSYRPSVRRYPSPSVRKPAPSVRKAGPVIAGGSLVRKKGGSRGVGEAVVIGAAGGAAAGILTNNLQRRNYHHKKNDATTTYTQQSKTNIIFVTLISFICVRLIH